MNVVSCFQILLNKAASASENVSLMNLAPMAGSDTDQSYESKHEDDPGDVLEPGEVEGPAVVPPAVASNDGAEKLDPFAVVGVPPPVPLGPTPPCCT